MLNVKSFSNIFRIPDLKRKFLVTIALLAVYRVGCFIPVPGIDSGALADFFQKQSQAQGGSIFGILNMFSGGAIENATVFALGIMPYISCSIIIQLLTAVIPALEKLSKEGKSGYEKINQFTRYGTVFLCMFQAFLIAKWLESPSQFGDTGIVMHPGLGFKLLTMLTLTTGTMVIMWMGEQIQENGIGNGISLIIAAGIISRFPNALIQLFQLIKLGELLMPVLFIMLALFVIVVLAVTFVTQGQRRIPVQYARRIVGRKIMGGQSTYLPIKVDTSGVIAIILAQIIILFPATIATFIPNASIRNFANILMRGHFIYYILNALLIVFFCYFYTALMFNPIDISNNMKKYGGFIPGVRPGKPTTDFLIFVLNRITLVGALFIAIIAVFPDIIMAGLKVPYSVASFFGGTGILIIVGVMLDSLKQLQSQLLMHHYEGFIKTGIRGRRT